MSDIIIRQEGKAGRITLNRPQALNALTHQMVLEIESALDCWHSDQSVQLIYIDAQGHKAFCAGGDIVSIYQDGQEGRADNANQFWRDEYRLNFKIANYPKPYVAMIDGLVMGGGAGISVHGSHRIVTENTIFAMPECSIGLIPDVGMNYHLAQAPGSLGEYIGLTGVRLDAADCIYAGCADLYVPASERAHVEAAVMDGDMSALQSCGIKTGTSKLQEMQDQIDAVFDQLDLTEIAKALEDWPDVLNMLQRSSPLSACVFLHILRQVRTERSLAQALKYEFRFTSRSVLETDFLEGIRAAVIDKDRTPKWRISHVDDVSKSDMAPFFDIAPGGDVELGE